jgi:hypothetical protein
MDNMNVYIMEFGDGGHYLGNYMVRIKAVQRRCPVGNKIERQILVAFDEVRERDKYLVFLT